LHFTTKKKMGSSLSATTYMHALQYTTFLVHEILLSVTKRPTYSHVDVEKSVD